MVPFAGYEMPVQYPAGILKEHLHTREKAGLFDVSHMGQAFLAGDDPARRWNASRPPMSQGLKEGMQRYGLLLNDARHHQGRFHVLAAGGRGGALSGRQCRDQGRRLRLYRREAARAPRR